MLRDYAVSMMLILFVLLGYTALLFWKKNETPNATAARTDVRVEASVSPDQSLRPSLNLAPNPSMTTAAPDSSARAVEHN